MIYNKIKQDRKDTKLLPIGLHCNIQYTLCIQRSPTGTKVPENRFQIKLSSHVKVTLIMINQRSKVT